MKVVKRDLTDQLAALDMLDDLDEDELKPAQRAGLEFLRKNTKIQDRGSLEELTEEFQEIDGLKDKHIIKLLELLPTHIEELDVLFSKERIKLDESQKQQIIDICTSYSE